MDIIVGTAGHIDHGKTALVKTLTGTDADRLPDEKRRGITIDLGFAEATIGDTHFGFVDVPGHERFVRNMLAGASGIDIVLLVIAADEGVMPQTREHFDICRLLGIKSGIIALTKSDLVDAETLDLARMDVADLVQGSFLAESSIIAVSSRSGTGIEELRTALAGAAGGIPARSKTLVTRLPIDRSFTVKGFGTVVTGTLASGEITPDSQVELLPIRRPVRIRGLQTHGFQTDRAIAGQRTAVNLAGVDTAEVGRGMSLVDASTLRPTQVLDAQVEVIKSAPRSLRSRQRVRVHIGAAELLGRLQILNEEGELIAGSSGFVQLRLESPTSAIPGERFIIRSYSPQSTIAGGIVVDPLAERHRRRELRDVTAFLAEVNTVLGDPARMIGAFIGKAGGSGRSLADLVAQTGLRRNVIEEELRSGGFIDAGGRYLRTTRFNSLVEASMSSVEKFHAANKLAKGVPRETLRTDVFAHLPIEVFEAVIDALISKGAISLSNDLIIRAAHRTELSANETLFRDRVVSILRSAGLAVPRIDEIVIDTAAKARLSAADAEKLLKAFAASEELIRVTDEFYFEPETIAALTHKLRMSADTTEDRLIDVAAFKELAGVSRKYAIPLLEYFDRVGVTRRAGEKRVVTK